VTSVTLVLLFCCTRFGGNSKCERAAAARSVFPPKDSPPSPRAGPTRGGPPPDWAQGRCQCYKRWTLPPRPASPSTSRSVGNTLRRATPRPPAIVSCLTVSTSSLPRCRWSRTALWTALQRRFVRRVHLQVHRLFSGTAEGAVRTVNAFPPLAPLTTLRASPIVVCRTFLTT
jgi:hypothetical protein